ncbi:MAG: CDP-diacylglycerol--glycerol-3-phosphate 3-phosphatidyltransferase [Treponema sp.]
MNLANFFTATRIVCAPIFLMFILLPQYVSVNEKLTLAIAAGLFAYLEFTDFLDGYYARKYHQVSDFGKLFDPFADVIANISILLVFLLLGYVPVICFVVILYREMAISFLRMIARGNGITIAAKKGGKTKTVCYIIAEALSLLIHVCVRMFALQGTSFIAALGVINKIIYGAAAVLAVLSFFDYLISYQKAKKATCTRDTEETPLHNPKA